MGSFRAAVVLCGVVWAVAGARAGEPAGQHRHRVAPERVLGSRRSVAVAVLVPSGLIIDRTDRGELAERVERALRDAGVAVVGWQDAQPVVDAAWKKEGAIDREESDAETVQRWKRVHGGALRSLRARFGVERLVVVGLLPGKQTAVDGKVSWEGVEEHAIADGIWTWELQNGRHTLWALSVAVWVHGEGGELLYGEGGGLRLMELAGPEGKAVPVPDADMLADPERNARAVQLALAPLLDEMEAAGMRSGSASR